MSTFFCQYHGRLEDSDKVGFQTVHLTDTSQTVLTGIGRRISTLYACDEGTYSYARRECIDCDWLVPVTELRCYGCEEERREMIRDDEYPPSRRELNRL